MNHEDIFDTEIWQLYAKGQDYHRITGIYTDTDRNYRMYNGDQWGGAKLGGIEPVQKNFIKPIVKYKLSVIHDNLYRAVFSSMNYENKAFRGTAEKCCELLNGYIARLWEQDKMDDRLREVTEDAAINDEGVFYIYWDAEEKRPVHEVVKKNDIYYGDENEEDIQAQPYILIRKRMAVSNAIDLALSHGVENDKLSYIIGDNATLEETGEASKIEVDDRITVVYKLYKRHGTVRFSVATRYVDIAEDEDTLLTLYPVAHMTWERKAGSARGEGEVRYLIPNQIEVNRTEMRRVLTVREQAYPMRVVDVSKVENPNALDTVGGTIRTNGQPVDDVNKIIGTIAPAQMSTDVKELQESLIQVTRDLAGAGDTATGQVNPEAASGRAILAVQQASHAPMTAQKEKTKSIIEDVARIDLEYLIVNSQDGIDMLEEVTDQNTGKETMQVVNVPQSVWEKLQATVKIEVTPKGVYDKFAQEQTLENLLVQGFFSVQRLPEFEAYVEALDDDSVAPKQKLEGILKRMKDEQRRIAMIQAQAQMMQQRAQQFLMEDPDGQAAQIAEAQAQMDAEAALAAEEEEYAEQEAELDEGTAEAEEETDEE
jgi:hypothetical protein